MPAENCTITKRYQEIPFAHRQPRHSGHCKLLHGHNWTIEATFSCIRPDEVGFVVDFGKLKAIQEWINLNLDHSTVVSSDDPELPRWRELAGEQLMKVCVVKEASAEGLAEAFWNIFSDIVDREFGERVAVVSVRVEEDSRNSATFYPHGR